MWRFLALLAAAVPAAALNSDEFSQGRTALSGHEGAATSAAFSPDSRSLASAGVDGTVRLWDVGKGAAALTLRGCQGAAAATAFSADGRPAAACADGTVRLWDLKTGRQRLRLEEGRGPLSSLAFSTDGKLLAAGGEDGVIRLWDLPKRRLRALLSGHVGAVAGLAFSPDSRTLASAGADRLVGFWQAPWGRPRGLSAGHTGWVQAVAFSPDGETLASGGGDASVRLWQAATGAAVETLKGNNRQVRSLAYSPDGKTLAVGAVDTVRFWQPAFLREAGALPGLAARVRGLAFSPDGNSLAVAGEDGTVWLYAAQAVMPKDAPRAMTPARLEVRAVFQGAPLAAEDEGELEVLVKNTGQGPAYDVQLLPSTTGELTLPARITVGTVLPGRTVRKQVRVRTAQSTAAQKTEVVLRTREGNGATSPPLSVTLETREDPGGRLEATLEGPAQTQADRKTKICLQAKNAGPGRLRELKVRFEADSAQASWPGGMTAPVGTLEAGAAKTVCLDLSVSEAFLREGRALRVSGELADGRGRSEPAQVMELTVLRKPPEARHREAFVSGTDTAPASTLAPDRRALAVVIGIEHYPVLAPADFAARDARTMRDYLTGPMGFSEENVLSLINGQATKEALEGALELWLQERATRGGRVFVFFAGLGAPDPLTGETYLLPVDGDTSDISGTGYPVRQLLESMAALPSKSVVVALDAGFSGTGGRSALARGASAAIEGLPLTVSSNTVLLSAAGREQLSAASPEGRHGLLSYFLFRGLRGEADADQDGQIKTAELFAFVQEAVGKAARLQDREQDPKVLPAALGDRGADVWVRSTMGITAQQGQPKDSASEAHRE